MDNLYISLCITLEQKLLYVGLDVSLDKATERIINTSIGGHNRYAAFKFYTPDFKKRAITWGIEWGIKEVDMIQQLKSIMVNLYDNHY
jgi:hypothetical protein